jgi:hypothetical protein
MRSYPSFPIRQGDTATLWTLNHVVDPHTTESSSKMSQDADESVDTPFPRVPSQWATDESRRNSTFDASGFPWPVDSDGKASLSYENARELLCRPVPELSWPSDESSQCSDDLKRDYTSSPSETAESSAVGNRGLVVNRQHKRSPQSARLEDTITCAMNETAPDEKDRKVHLRGCHNKVEKNYRNRLNKDFQLLLNALTECMDENDLASTGFTQGTARTRSKGSILRLARRRLLALHTENCLMASELKTMRRNWMESQMGHVFKPSSENAM